METLDALCGETVFSLITSAEDPHPVVGVLRYGGDAANAISLPLHAAFCDRLQSIANRAAGPSLMASFTIAGAAGGGSTPQSPIPPGSPLSGSGSATSANNNNNNNLNPKLFILPLKNEAEIYRKQSLITPNDALSALSRETSAGAASGAVGANPGGLKAMRGIIKAEWYVKHSRRSSSALFIMFNLDALVRDTMPQQQQQSSSSTEGGGGDASSTESAAATAAATPAVDPAVEATRHRNLIENYLISAVDKIRDLLRGNGNVRLMAVLVTSRPLNASVWDPSIHHSHNARPSLSFDELTNSVRYRCRIEHCSAVTVASAAILAKNIPATAPVPRTFFNEIGGADTMAFTRFHNVAVDAALKYHRDEYSRVKKLKDDRTGATEVDLHKIAVRRRAKIAWHSEILRDVKTTIHNYDRARYELSQVPISVEAIFIDAVLILRRLRYCDMDVFAKFVDQMFQLMNLAENFDVRAHFPNDSATQIVARLLLFHLCAEMFRALAKQITLALPAVPGIDSSVIFMCRGPNRPLPTSLACHPARALFCALGVLRRIRELTQFAESALRSCGDTEEQKLAATGYITAPAVPNHEYLGQFDRSRSAAMLARLVSVCGVRKISNLMVATAKELETLCQVSPRMHVMLRCVEAEHHSLMISSPSKEAGASRSSNNDDHEKQQDETHQKQIEHCLVSAISTEPVQTYTPVADWIHVGLERCTAVTQHQQHRGAEQQQQVHVDPKIHGDDTDSAKRGTSPEASEPQQPPPSTVAAGSAQSIRSSSSRSPPAAAAAQNKQLSHQQQQHPPTGSPITSQGLLSNPAFFTPAYHLTHLAVSSPEQVRRRRQIAKLLSSSAAEETATAAISSALFPHLVCRVRFPSAFYEPDPSGIVARVELTSAPGSYFPQEIRVAKVTLNLKVTTTVLKGKQTQLQQQQQQQGQEESTSTATTIPSGSFALASSLSQQSVSQHLTLTVDVTNNNTFIKRHFLSSWGQVIEVDADALATVITPQTTCVACESVDVVLNWPSSSSSLPLTVTVHGIPVTTASAVPDVISRIIKGGLSVVDSRGLACGTWFPGVVLLSPPSAVRVAVLSESGALEGEDFHVSIGWRMDKKTKTNNNNKQEDDQDQDDDKIERMLWSFSVHSLYFDLATDIRYSKQQQAQQNNQREPSIGQESEEDLSDPPVQWSKDTGRTRDPHIFLIRGEQDMTTTMSSTGATTTAAGRTNGSISVPLHCLHAGRYRIPFRVVYVTSLKTKYSSSNSSDTVKKDWKIQRCARGYVFLHVRNPLLTVTTVRKATAGQSLLRSPATLSQLLSHDAADGAGPDPSHCLPAESELARFVEIADQKLTTPDVRATSLPYHEGCQAVHDNLFRVPFVEGDSLPTNSSNNNNSSSSTSNNAAEQMLSSNLSVTSALFNNSFAITGEQGGKFPIIDTGVADPIPQHKMQSVSMRQEHPRTNTSATAANTNNNNAASSSSSGAPQPLIVVAGEPHLLLSTFTNHETFPIVVHKAAPASIAHQRAVRVVAAAAGTTKSGNETNSNNYSDVTFPVTLRPQESVCIATVAEVVLLDSKQQQTTGGAANAAVVVPFSPMAASPNSAAGMISQHENHSSSIQLGALVVVISREQQSQQQQQKQQQHQLIEYTTALPSAARVYEPRVLFGCAWPPVARLHEPFVLKITMQNLRPFSQRVAVRVGTTGGPLGLGHGVTVVPTGRVQFVVELPAAAAAAAAPVPLKQHEGQEATLINTTTKIFFLHLVPTECGMSTIPPIEARVIAVPPPPGAATGVVGGAQQQQQQQQQEAALPNLVLSSVVERRTVFVSPQ